MRNNRWNMNDQLFRGYLWSFVRNWWIWLRFWIYWYSLWDILVNSFWTLVILVGRILCIKNSDRYSFYVSYSERQIAQVPLLKMFCWIYVILNELCCSFVGLTHPLRLPMLGKWYFMVETSLLSKSFI